MFGRRSLLKSLGVAAVALVPAPARPVSGVTLGAAPGQDTLVFTLATELDGPAGERLAADIRAHFPEHRIVLLTPGLTLTCLVPGAPR